MEETSGSEDTLECNDTDGSKSLGADKKNPPKGKEYHTTCKQKRSVKRKLKTFTFGKWHKGMNKEKAKKRKTWNFRLNQQSWQSSCSIASESSVESVTCICTGYRKTKTISSEHNIMESMNSLPMLNDECPSSTVDEANLQPSSSFTCSPYDQVNHSITPSDPAYEVQAVSPNREVILTCPVAQHPIAINEVSLSELTIALRNHLRITVISNPFMHRYSEVGLPYQLHCNDTEHVCERAVDKLYPSVHTQVDYAHFLVPDLLEITNCGFYWGKMDRYKAEKQLEKKPEGTFLLRDSAQEEFLFSVSFRRYRRTLHARIEQLNHKFSFDSHDPNVFASTTVCGLIEHYKNPRCCMFFEPMLTLPVHRTFPFSLQHLCRAVITDSIAYDDINKLILPKKIKSYLKEYHYKQQIRVRNLDDN